MTTQRDLPSSARGIRGLRETRLLTALLTLAWTGLVFALAGCAADSGAHEQIGGEGERVAYPEGTLVHDQAGVALGSVALETTCSPEATEHVRRGLGLLHHMTYVEAEGAFGEATSIDPNCALGYWGAALSYLHPLWPDVPAAEAFQRAGDLLDRAAAVEGTTARERAYIDALATYYAHGPEAREGERLSDYAAAWASVSERFPNDPEAALFHALTQIATATPSDRTYANRTRAGEIAESVLEAIPDHPGAHHYAIHAYDVPALADRALSVARNYGSVAPDNAHALHMTSHIFTRVGLWEESIEFNERSAAAAARHPINGAVSHHHLHALDYLAYAFIQRGDLEQAREVDAHVRTLTGPVVNSAASAYTFAAVPVRLALERGDWAEATTVPLRWPETIGWDGFPHLEAISQFGRAMGAARVGDLADAEVAVNRLADLVDAARSVPDAYDWATQVEIQRQAASAWIALANGQQEDALQTMREAADLESTTEKNPVTPGEVLPARELLGDMLLELGRYDEAGAAYRHALTRTPNRLNSLFGVARSAELAGDEATAAEFYSTLLGVVSDAAERLPEVVHAKAYLSAQ